MAKQSYYTKCGRKFEKNSTAVVTGYELGEDGRGELIDRTCAKCPWPVEVKEGWPQVHKRWECRAGSQPPNHTTEWTGSLENKNTISIHSLDHQLMEEIKEFCKNHPDLGAGYNADHMADCRRTMAISCSSNKKGMAAKRELIEKFFPEEEKWTLPESCLDCSYRPVVGKRTCNTIYVDRVASGKCGWYYNAKTEEMGDLLYKVEYGEDKPIETCEDCAHGIDYGESVEYIKCEESKKKKDVRKKQAGCANWIPANPEPSVTYEDDENAIEATPEAIEKVTTNVITFDYSTVDEETGAFLQEKANRITEIRIKSVIAMGKELKEAQDKLADHDKTKGTFQKWVGSIGITPRTAYNYINGFDYVVKNFHNIEDAENIQPSLLFAASKPSAPKELADKVVSGDITTHKQYKELERKLKDIQNKLDIVNHSKSEAELKAIKAVSALGDAQQNSKKSINALNATIHALQQQLDQAKRNSDPTKVRELGEIISEKQQEIETLKQQLHSKPIEVSAVETVIKVPDEVQRELDELRKKAAQPVNDAEQRYKVFFDIIVDNFKKLLSTLNELQQTDAACYSKYRRATAAMLQKLGEQVKDEPAPAPVPEPAGHCGDCVHADMDVVTEEQLDEGMTFCRANLLTVDIMDDGCSQYKFFGGES